MVAADPDRLVQTLVTLLLRAVRVVPSGGGRISVQTTSGDSVAVLKISDNGPVIPDANLPHVFDPYVVASPDGEGLGLAMCHRVITGLGGRLTLTSGPAGTEFTMELPEHEPRSSKV